MSTKCILPCALLLINAQLFETHAADDGQSTFKKIKRMFSFEQQRPATPPLPIIGMTVESLERLEARRAQQAKKACEEVRQKVVYGANRSTTPHFEITSYTGFDIPAFIDCMQMDADQEERKNRILALHKILALHEDPPATYVTNFVDELVKMPTFNTQDHRNYADLIIWKSLRNETWFKKVSEAQLLVIGRHASIDCPLRRLFDDYCIATNDEQREAFCRRFDVIMELYPQSALKQCSTRCGIMRCRQYKNITHNTSTQNGTVRKRSFINEIKARITDAPPH